MSLLERFQTDGRVAVVAYLVAGHPNREACLEAVDTLVESGIDILELGVPFSDAIADGPVIQSASESTATRMPRIEDTLNIAQVIHKKHPQLGLIIFSYFNPILACGIEAYAKCAKAAGVHSTLVVDLPPEEASAYREILDREKIGTIFLASPTTSPARVKQISEASSDFIYYVSRTGVTGTQSQLSRTLAAEVQTLRSHTHRPIAVGFGISSGSQAAEVAQWADAVVVGSAFVKCMNLPQASERNHALKKLAQEISHAVHAVKKPC